MYHTQCSLLINGNYTPTFHDEILPRIINNLESNPNISALDKMFAEIIDRGLKQSIDNPDIETSIMAPCLDTSCESSRSGNADGIVKSTDTCLHCNTKVDNGIACDNCQQWYHFDCESLDKNFRTFYSEGDTPYSCLSCRQFTVFTDDLINMIPDISMSSQEPMDCLQNIPWTLKMNFTLQSLILKTTQMGIVASIQIYTDQLHPTKKPYRKYYLLPRVIYQKLYPSMNNHL